MTTLLDPKVISVLDSIWRHAAASDDAGIERAFAVLAERDFDLDAAELSALLSDAALPVSSETGRFLYSLVRSARPQLIVEFGTSFGVSALHLAAGLRDAHSGGRFIGSELDAAKVAAALANCREAGLDDLVEIRVGDARQSLFDVGGPIDMVLLDGWKDLYLPVLQLLEPQLRDGAIVIADDLDIAPAQLADFLAYVREPLNGWISATVAIGDKMEVSTWTGR